ncbi:MAG TPA: choice-of-anchor R domain-containing protein [Solirubrobacterales bacterium]|nr:choice-of-anchor R domain-containing protein [Solirubrobacterales bacterium]
MRRLTWTALVTAIFAVSSGVPVAAAGTLDQQQTDSDDSVGLFNVGGIPAHGLAQTFTAGISGGIDQVDLELHKVGAPPSVTVEIRDATLTGTPGTTVLATAELPASAVPDDPAFVPTTFTTPAPVTAGTQYAIVAYSPGTIGNAAGWRYHSGEDPYADGAMFWSPVFPPAGSWNDTALVDGDAAFKTYVSTNSTPPNDTDPPNDVDPPETTITKHPRNRLDHSKAKFKFTSDEAGSKFECKIDRKKFKSCTSPKVVKHLDDGKHKFKVRAIDAVGNVDPTPDKDRFKVVD